MRLSKKLDYALISLATLSVSLLFVSLASVRPNTYAESEDSMIIQTKDAYFVTIYDNGEEKIVRSAPQTVGEIIKKVNISLNSADIIEPSLDTMVNADHFYINIYRSHPVIVTDGNIKKYTMTASYDPRTVANSAGLTIYDGDTIEMIPNTNFLEAGVAVAYEITRNGGRTVTVEEEIPFVERTVKDYNLNPGESRLDQIGEVGRKQVIYNVEYLNNKEVSRELISEEIVKAPVDRITAVGVTAIEKHPLTASMGRNYYTVTKPDGTKVERQETYYDLDMSGVMRLAKGWAGCNHSGHYSVRDDGVKIDDDGYVLVAAELSLYPRCSVVETSLGQGKVYDTGTFALSNPEQFDLATDWTKRNGY